MSFPNEYLYLPAIVLAFLVIDLLIEVGSLVALLSNIFFWLYWLIYSVAAETALYLLKHASAPAFASLPAPVLILIAITATTTILQSLTFKVGGKKVLDLSRYLDDYRRKVLSSSANLSNRAGTRRVLRQSRRILEKANYVAGNAESEAEMERLYAEVMLFGRRDPAKVQLELRRVRSAASTTGASFGNEIARRIAQADPDWVESFLDDAK